MTRGKIFINVRDNLDIHIITEGLEKNGFTYERGFISSTDEESTIRYCKDCIGVISGVEPWNERTLSAVKDKVRMIIRYGTGYNNIDLVAARRHGIAVFNAAGMNAASVAELALLHILNANRKFSVGIELAKIGQYNILDTECFELDGKTVGLYGAGAIARNLARMLMGFHVKKYAYDVVENEAIKQYGVMFVNSPEELFSISDIVSIHIPLLPTTKGIVNKRLLSLMKPNAILINTSRGQVINEEDLLYFLKNKKIRAAGLDVLCNEPISRIDPLVLQENAYVTPHIAASSFESKVRTEHCLYKTITDFFDGKYEVQFPPNYLNPPIQANK
ncbi:MAG TPA: 3-phosphoglycerate dehydrogenase [Clostridiaceae bacterium]|nr:3-phosphoglycerate dehydrogenase [Clostridiaceae bacterium]